MEKEKYINKISSSTIEFEEGKIKSFDKKSGITTQSFRVHKDGFMGIHYQSGKMSDEEGFKRAEENLKVKRPYPFELEPGYERSRDKTEKLFTDAELMEMAKKAFAHLNKKYPDFTFGGSFSQEVIERGYENTRGAKYSNKDGYVCADITLKHKDSKDIMDGQISFSARKFSMRKFYKNVDNYLENFTKEVEMPEDLIIQMQYYGFTGNLGSMLDAESVYEKTSLLGGKIGQKVFADDFSVFHCVDDKNCWMDGFWDGEGVVLKKDKLDYIKNGVIKRVYADKRIADKYKIKSTGSASFDWADIPKNGRIALTIKRSKKTTKELLNGKYTVIPFTYSGGGFNEKGDYKMPVQIGLLCDGEKILGRVPPFTMSSNIFDIFGKDFIGVGKDNPVFNDKSILVRMTAEKLL